MEWLQLQNLQPRSLCARNRTFGMPRRGAETVLEATIQPCSLAALQPFACDALNSDEQHTFALFARLCQDCVCSLDAFPEDFIAPEV